MAESTIASYGDHIAEIYDLLESPALDTEAAVDALGALAGAGPILELGIGTGRLGLPLGDRGIEVHGIEGSPAMIAKLQEKPNASSVKVTEGDFVDVPGTGAYSLVFAAFNTFCALLDQPTQVRCFANVARALKPGGTFVVEATVPDHERLSKRQDVWPRFIDERLAVLHAAKFDSVTQHAIGQYMVFADGVVRTFPIRLRYVWPSELDLMAQLAGLTLRDRWADWRGSAFNGASETHVSVYAKAS